MHTTKPNLKNIAKIQAQRVGAVEVLLTWNWQGGKPVSKEDFYLQVVPAEVEEDNRRAVVEKIYTKIKPDSFDDFVDGEDELVVPVHTSDNGQRIFYALSNEEFTENRKYLQLIPNHTYEVSVITRTVGSHYTQQSNVSRIRLGFIVLDVIGAGDLTKSTKYRSLQLGPCKLLTHSEQAQNHGHLMRQSSSVSNQIEAKWYHKDVEGQFNSAWFQEAGINITILDMQTLAPAYSRSFKTYGYKDHFRSSAADAELMTELSEMGEISKIRNLPNKHIWIITSSIGWEVRDSSLKLGELLGELMRALGMEEEESKKVEEASLLSKSESGRGCQPFVFVGVSPLSSGTVAFSMPKWDNSQYSEARVKLALSFDDEQWFPAFKWTGDHWQVWNSPMCEEAPPKIQRVGTSKHIKLKRNHIVIQELEDLCKFLSKAGNNSGMPLDLVSFLQIILDMINGYTLKSQGPCGSNEAPASDKHVEYGIHDPCLPSPKAFTVALEQFSAQLELVLSRLILDYDIASQVIEAGIVEFLLSRMSLYYGNQDHEKLCSSLWLLCLLTCEEGINLQQTPRYFGGETLGTLIEYSENPQPRLLPELCRRGVIEMAAKTFDECWKHAVASMQYVLLHRLSVLFLQVAEMRPSVARLSFSKRENDGEKVDFQVNALQTRLPTKKVQIPINEMLVKLVAVERMNNPYESDKIASWGPGWSGSRELLSFTKDSMKFAAGKILLIPPSNNWKEHCAIVLQACRLVWMASVAGAVAVIFVWPGPIIQQIHPNLNFAQDTPIPSFIIPDLPHIRVLFDEYTGSDKVNKKVFCSMSMSKCSLKEVATTRCTQCSEPSAIPGKIAIQFETCFKQIMKYVPKLVPEKKRPIKVLCLDGGGVKGLSTICMLEVIFEEMQGIFNGENGGHQMSSVFDLIVGTSAGGITAMALGAGMHLKDIREFFKESVHEIFASKDSYWEQLQRGPGASAARRFQDIIKKEWLNKTKTCSADMPFFSVPYHREESHLGRQPGVCLVSTLVSREPARTCILKNYCSDTNSMSFLPAEHRASILQCTRATSAAPYYLEEMLCYKDICTGKYFSSHSDNTTKKSQAFHLDPVMTTYRFIDGAISVNNPTCAAILEAKNTYPGHPLVVVSLGTGIGLSRCPIKTYPSGIGVMLQNLTSATADVSLADVQAKEMLRDPSDKYYRFCPRGDVFNCDIGTKDAKIIERISEEAKAYMKASSVRDKVRRMIVDLGNDMP